MLPQRAADVLHSAEGDIAALANQATKDRDYDLAERLLGVARQLAATADRLAASPKAPPHEHHGSNGRLHVPPAAAPAAAPSSPGDDAEDGDDAPHFERDGDTLVKRGKSKSLAGAAYEHKAPRAAIDTLLRAIRAASNKKGEFRTSRIFPLQDKDGRKLPVYQGYLALRWLRQIGLVDRVARQRYKLDPERDPVSYVEDSWQSLPQR